MAVSIFGLSSSVHFIIVDKDCLYTDSKAFSFTQSKFHHSIEWVWSHNEKSYAHTEVLDD